MKTGIIIVVEQGKIIVADHKNLENLKLAIENSLYVATAWRNSRLVGLIRIIGDAVSIIYIQDIIVLPEFHSKGIGSLLMNKVLTKFGSVR